MRSFSLPSFAKINWTLRVLGKRDDGFHELFTVLQTVSLHDTLHEFEGPIRVFVEDILEWNGIISPDGIAKGDKIFLTKEAATKAGLITAGVPKIEKDKPVVKVKTHVVAKGETAYRICKTYGINTSQLISWNALKSADSIREGQKLRVGE